MKTIFGREPWGQSKLGQFSWNNAGTQQAGGFYSWNSYGQGTPEQRLLKAAQESMNAPQPLTPEQRLLQTAKESMNPTAGECFTCVMGGEVKTGVDAATAANLKAQGYRCRKDECAQQQSGGVNFGGYGNLFTSSVAAPSAVNYGGESYGGYGGYGGMMGRALRVVNL